MALIYLNNAVLRGYLASLGHKPKDGHLHLFGIRGARAAAPAAVDTHEDVPNLWNDAMGTFGSAWNLSRATTDPGKKWTRAPENPAGAAHLLACDEPGGAPWIYQLGLHKGKPALVQAAPVAVRRDRDRDDKAEPHEPIDRGFFGINHHAGGFGPQVGAWSAGCQAVWAPDWSDYYATCVASKEKHFNYYLLTGSKLHAWCRKHMPAALNL